MPINNEFFARLLLILTFAGLNAQTEPLLILQATKNNRVVTYLPSVHNVDIDSIASDAELSFLMNHVNLIEENITYSFDQLGIRFEDLGLEGPYFQKFINPLLYPGVKKNIELTFSFADDEKESVILTPVERFDTNSLIEKINNQESSFLGANDPVWEFNFPQLGAAAKHIAKKHQLPFRFCSLKKPIAIFLLYFIFKDEVRAFLADGDNNGESGEKLPGVTPSKYQGMDVQLKKRFQEKIQASGRIVVGSVYSLETFSDLLNALKINERSSESISDMESIILGLTDDLGDVPYFNSIFDANEWLNRFYSQKHIYNENFINARNAWWVPQLDLLNNKTLVIAGVLHFPGDGGIIRGLIEKGWEWQLVEIANDGSIVRSTCEDCI